MGVTDACCDEDFIFEGRKIVYVLDRKGTVWIKSKEIADILFYADNEDITQRLEAEDYAQFYTLDPKIVGGEKEIESQAVFLNQNGIHSLVLDSGGPELELTRWGKMELTRWIVNMVSKILEFERKSKIEKLEDMFIRLKFREAEIFGLKSEVKEKNLALNERIADVMMMQRLIQFLRDEKRASEAALELQIKDAEAMQRQVQVLIAENRDKDEEIEERNIKIRNLELKFRKLETENQSKNKLLDQAINDKNTMQNLLRDLEIGNRTKDETLEQSLNQTKTMHNDMIELKKDNIKLNLQTQKQQDIVESYEKVMRKQDVLFHLLKENFLPKPYDKKLENKFLIFNLNEEDFFTYYAVNVQNSNLNRQIKTIRARHPNSVELLRIPFYPNAVDLISLLKNHLKDKIRFTDNYFDIQLDEYSDKDLQDDVFKIFKEAEHTRRQVFRMMCIERDYRSTENKCSAAESDDEPSVNGNEATIKIGMNYCYNSDSEEDNSTCDSSPPLANECSCDSGPPLASESSNNAAGDNSTFDSGPPPANESSSDAAGDDSGPPLANESSSDAEGDDSGPPLANESSSDVEGENSTFDSNPEDMYSDMFPYRDVVPDANA